jgi:immune inhibitor A
MLVTYWDTDQANNNTITHPGEGRSLPIDAHPEPLRRRDLVKGGTPWNFAPWAARYQAYDSTFGLKPTDPLSLPFRGTLPGVINDTGCVPSGANTLCQFNTEYPSLPGVPVFNDLNDYWFAETSAAGVIVPKTGTTIRVVNTSAQDSFMQIQVTAGR